MMFIPILDIKVKELILCYHHFRAVIIQLCNVFDSRIFPLNDRYRKVDRNSYQTQNIEDSAEAAHMSLDILSAVVVYPCTELMRENIYSCYSHCDDLNDLILKSRIKIS